MVALFYFYAYMAVKPQPGFQEMALSTPADIAILGGSAGCGKTFTLLCEFTRNTNNNKWGGVIFRRTTPQITSEGGLWDTSMNLYPMLGAVPIESRLSWRFKSGCKLKFAHLEYDKNVLDWQGSQIGFIGFDELTHFTQDQFFYMLSRNRSEAGPKPYVRATCNPDPDSWVAQFIEWYIDQETGFPILEHAGKLRYMTRDGDNIVWGDSPKEVVDRCPHIFSNAALVSSGIDQKDLIKSVTFIPGSIYENKIFLKEDPAYLGNLLSMREEERARLLDGNWKIRTDGLAIVDYNAAAAIFTNYPDVTQRPARYITCDAARFGRDLCVILVWKGWEIVYTVVYTKSDVHDVVNKIEQLRQKFTIMKHNVMIDQDGVGGGAVKLGQYRGFKGGAQAMKDPETRIVENYKNLKTQCYYRFLERRVNNGIVKFNLDRELIEVYDDSKLKGHLSVEVKVGNKVTEIRKLILADLRSVKRKDPDLEGKLQIITKEEQKNILLRSPDFGDTLMMREAFELIPEQKNMHRNN